MSHCQAKSLGWHSGMGCLAARVDATLRRSSVKASDHWTTHLIRGAGTAALACFPPTFLSILSPELLSSPQFLTMKLSTGISLISSLAGAAVATPLALDPYNSSLVESNKLRRVLHREVLYEHAKKFQSFADSTPERNRVAGSTGHNLTVDYLYDTLVATGYYNVEKQPFTYIFSQGNTSFSALSTEYPSEYMTYSPSTGGSTITAQLVKVANLGCDQVRQRVSCCDNSRTHHQK